MVGMTARIVKTMGICFLLALGASPLFSQVAEPPFLPMSPSVMAQGGSSIAVAHGYDALFSNPAGFVETNGSWTLLSANPWIYANPIRVVQPLIDGLENLESVIAGEITSGGFGIGAAAGIAYVGNGLGLGVTVIGDSYLFGQNLLGAKGCAHITVGFTGGYALSFRLLGMDIALGAALRPMLRINVPADGEDILSFVDLFAGTSDIMAALSDVDAMHGIGLGIDAGAIVDLGNLKLAVSFRDIGDTEFLYSESKLGDILQGITAGFPEGTPITDEAYAIPMNISVGAALDPDVGLLTRLLDPVFHVELRDLLGVINEEKSPWTLLHVGAQVRVLSLLSLRAGLYQGYLTMGAGLNLGIADVNVAVFTRELGKHLTDRPNSGMTAEVAVRF